MPISESGKLHLHYNDLPFSRKWLFIFGGLSFGLSAVAFFQYWKRKKASMRDEGFEEVKIKDEIQEKRILVVGLNGSGKSTFLSHLSKVEQPKPLPLPTEGFNVVCVSTGVGGISLNFWEIGGSENIRAYWCNFLQDTDLVIFVVDSTDVRRLPQAVTELIKLAADSRLGKVPILILANKQDLPNAQSPEKIAEALGVKDISAKGHVVEVLTLQVPPGEASHPSVQIARRHIEKLSLRK